MNETSAPTFRQPLTGDIAIIGVACTYPGARRASDFWTNIVNRVDAISEVSREHWDPDVFYDPDPAKPDRLYCKKGGWIPDTFTFDPAKFGIPPASVEGGEPDHYLLLRCAFEALDDAGYLKRDFDRERSSIIIGKGNYVAPGLLRSTLRTGVAEMVLQIVKQLRPDMGPEQLQRLVQYLRSKLPHITADSAPGIVPNIATGRIANRFDFMGRNFTLDAACASSLIATEVAVRNLLTGLDDMAIVGGIHVYNHLPFLTVFKVTRAISLTSTIRPFDSQADGTMSGEGVGLVVLKRLADAERDADRIYAVIKGIGTSSDGRAKGVMVPRLEGEVLAIQRAYEMAGIPPESVDLVECHGTATVVGDSTEIEALRQVYGSSADGHPTCALGSVKSMIGHTMPSSGAAAMIKTAMALYHRVLPPTLNVTDPHPLLRERDSRFYVNSETRPWIHAPGEPRRAAVSAFGFGGINAHMVMEEHTRTAESSLPSLLRDWECEMIVVEESSRNKLLARLDNLRAYVLTAEGVSLRDVAYTCNTSLSNAEHRVGIVAASLEDLAHKIDQIRARLEDGDCRTIRERSGLYYFADPELRRGKVAAMFSGEGSQYLNMLGELCVHFPEVRACFDSADAAGGDPARQPLSSVIFPPALYSASEKALAESQLWSIERATEAVLTAGGAMFTLLEKLGIKPDMMTGHSAGEWIAMAASGMVGVPEFINGMNRLATMYRALAERTEVPSMVMLAVGAGRDRVNDLAQELGFPIHIANDNCPHQVVVVANPADSAALTAHLLKNGLFVETLPYDRGYHTPAFTYICDPLREFFSSLNLSPPKLPVYSCSTVAPYSSNPAEVIETAANTFSKPLLFRQTIEQMYDAGARIFIEAGPRGNLTAFVDDTLRGKPHLAVPVDSFSRPGLRGLNHAMAMLAAAHVPLDFQPLYSRRAPRTLTWDARADSILPEEKQPGAMQISVCYPSLPTPAAADFPMPAGPLPVEQDSVHVATVASHSNGTRQSHATLPANGAVAGPSVPIPLPAATLSNASGVLADHFALMDEFLTLHQDIMSVALRSNRAGERTQAPAVSDVATSHSVAAPSVVLHARESTVLVSEPLVTPVHQERLNVAESLLRIVSDRTGYPVEMLGLEQDMEADLGIDSIKRVEIFSAFRDLFPAGNGAEQQEMESVAKLKTLQQAVSFLEAQMRAGLPLVEAQTKPAVEVISSLASVTRSERAPADVRELLLKIVSDRTGYPVEMLDLDQDMEADLGIDSIKRIEILSALRDVSPQGPLAGDTDMDAVARFKTLRQVSDFIVRQSDNISSSAMAAVAGVGSLTVAVTQTESFAVPGHTVFPGVDVKGIDSLIQSAQLISQSSSGITLLLHLDLAEHAYLRDHSLYFPASEAGNEADRIFIMPLTGVIELMCQTALQLAPQHRIIGVSSAQAHRPLKLTENQPPLPIQLVATVTTPGQIRVEIRENAAGQSSLYSESTILVGSSYAPAPALLPLDFVNQKAPVYCKGKDIYSTHRMFHGPSFQGIRSIDEVAENGLFGTLEILPTDKLLHSNSSPQFCIDPFVLDAAGQMVGYWPVEYKDSGYIVLPIRIREIAKYCENPVPGSVIECRLRIRDVQRRTLIADYDLIAPDGRLWLRVIGWEDWRFYWPDRFYDVWRFPKTQLLSDVLPIPGLSLAGYQCCLANTATEFEKDGISIDAWTHMSLDRRELAEMNDMPSEQRMPWLHVRAVMKDAVRAWVTDRTQQDLYPADIELSTLTDGSYQSGGFWAQERHAPVVKPYVCDKIVLAIAGREHFAIAAVSTNNAAIPNFLPNDEVEWLSRLPDPQDWMLRVMAAKQAAARYLRASPTEDFQNSLVITKIDAGQGRLELMDPDSAVNAEDSVTVVTSRHGAVVIAAAFK